MSLASADVRNEKELAYWNGPAGQHWVRLQEAQDEMLAPVADAAYARAAVRAGERIVDIGCGTGATSIELARRVGANGHVLAIDISEPMLARARERAPAGAPIEFVNADATTYPFAQGRFDLLFSRFGVMFFAEPARTFANMRRALRPGGRLAFACWRKTDENPWMMVSLQAALKHVPPPPRPGPEDPGPYSFASEERVRRILGEAGFQSVRLEPVDLSFDIARGSGLDAAVKSALEIGPTSRVLQDAPKETRDAVVAAVRSALAPYQRGNTVPLAAAIWIVTAVNA